MKRFFKRKYLILSLFFSFILCLGLGFCIPLNSASALPKSDNIESYEWANYWNPDGARPKDGKDIVLAIGDSSIITDSVTFGDGTGAYSYGIPCSVIKPSSSVNIYHAVDMFLLWDNGSNLFNDISHLYPLRVHDDSFSDSNFSFGLNYMFDRADIVATVNVYFVLYEASGSIQSPLFEFTITDYFNFPSVQEVLNAAGEETSVMLCAGLHYVILFQENCSDLSRFEGFNAHLKASYTLHCSDYIWSYSPYFYSSQFSVLPSGESIFSSFPVRIGIPSREFSSKLLSIEREGYSNGYSTGYDFGWDDGYSNGELRGYQSGKDEGLSLGREEGYLNGLKSAQYGIFANCEATLHIVSSSNNALGYIQQDFPADIEYVYGGISLTPSYTHYNPIYKDSVLSSWVTFSWSNTDSVFPNNFKLKGYGTSDLFMDSSSHSLSWDMESSDSSYLPFLMWENINSNDSYLSPVYASSLGAHSGFPNVESEILSLTTPVISNLDYLNGFSLVMSDISYEGGYNAGLIAGDEETYNKGYNEGVIVGTDEGFKAGLSQGLSEDAYGLGQFMYTYLDMPGRILSNWLNFDFLGVNLLGLVTFLLSICLVVFVLKKVV